MGNSTYWEDVPTSCFYTYEQCNESVFAEFVVRAVILCWWGWIKGRLRRFKQYIQSNDISHLRKVFILS